MVLPRLGGSPAVWSVAMVFFQSLLLAGYAYAHYLMRIKSRLIPVVVHLVLLIIALFRAAAGDCRAAGANRRPRVMRSGCSACSWPRSGCRSSRSPPIIPLLQAWFVRTGHPDGADPYFLYASSNIGSFLALLSYPLLLEPMFTLRTQNLIWTGGYGLLIVLIAACGLLLWRAPATVAADAG